MKPYSKEFRGQVLAACDRGRSTREAATYFEVSESWVRRIKQERRELNKTAPLLKRRRTPLWAALADRMREIIQRKPDLTLRELKSELQTDLSVQTLCTALQRLRLTVKKKAPQQNLWVQTACSHGLCPEVVKACTSLAVPICRCVCRIASVVLAGSEPAAASLKRLAT